MVDIGANLTNTVFHDDIDDVLRNAFDKNIKSIIITGTSVKNSEDAISLCSKYHQYKLFSTVGIHPHNAKHMNSQSEVELSKLIVSNKCVKAVGECGLDFNRMFSNKKSQIKCFEMQIELALKYKLPLFLHERDAHKEFLEVLDKYRDRLKDIKVVVHCFTGNKTQAKEYVDRGFYIGITGWLCDNQRNKDLIEAVKHIPLERIMVETDSPFLTPPESKARRNTPDNIMIVIDRLAVLLGVDRKALDFIILKNTIDFFGLYNI